MWIPVCMESSLGYHSAEILGESGFKTRLPFCCDCITTTRTTTMCGKFPWWESAHWIAQTMPKLWAFLQREGCRKEWKMYEFSIKKTDIKVGEISPNVKLGTLSADQAQAVLDLINELIGTNWEVKIREEVAW